MHVFGKLRSLSFVSGLIVAGMLAGCRSATDLDTYPSVYGQRAAATEQMTNEEAVNMQERLTALASQRSSGSISEAEYQRRLKELQTLAEQHGPDTLKQIEN
ncbi:MAG TPA: SHOCT domain-containing protein [Sinorhizobium sp.]|nr:SHOCT domain-containing protein [Sinorhizobium sp.]